MGAIFQAEPASVTTKNRGKKAPATVTPATSSGSAASSTKTSATSSTGNELNDLADPRLILRFVDAYEMALVAEPPLGIDASEWERLLECAKPIREALERYLSHEVSTMDEAFRVRRPANYKQPPEYERAAKSGLVYTDCMRLYHFGVPVDAALFEAVGALHGLQPSRARDYFYYAKKLRGIAKLRERRWHALPARLADLDIAKTHAAKPEFRTSAVKPGKTSKR